MIFFEENEQVQQYRQLLHRVLVIVLMLFLVVDLILSCLSPFFFLVFVYVSLLYHVHRNERRAQAHIYKENHRWRLR